MRIISEHRFLDRVAVGDAGDHEVGALRESGRCIDCFGTRFQQWCKARSGAIPHQDRMPAVDEASHDRRSQRAGARTADGRK